jgi:DNA-binding MarR family transcriptional regulator
MARDPIASRTDALDKLLELALLLNADMASSLPADGVTPSRAALLWHLGQHGPTTQRDLAEAMGVAPRTVTGLVDALVETGFVTRQPHPVDRRATLVTFTARGRRVVAKWQRQHVEFAQLLFDGMSGRRFDGLVAGLDDVLETLRAHLPSPVEARP